MFVEKARCFLCDLFSMDCRTGLTSPTLPPPPSLSQSTPLNLLFPNFRDLMVAYLRGKSF